MCVCTFVCVCVVCVCVCVCVGILIGKGKSVEVMCVYGERGEDLCWKRRAMQGWDGREGREVGGCVNFIPTSLCLPNVEISFLQQNTWLH